MTGNSIWVAEDGEFEIVKSEGNPCLADKERIPKTDAGKQLRGFFIAKLPF